MTAADFYVRLATVVVAALAFAGSLVALFNTLSVARAQLYLELRKRFAEINAQLPRGSENGKRYWDKGWLPDPESKDFAIFERYWYHAFDEWFVTNVLHPFRFGKLWRKFYRRAIFQGARHDAIRYALYRMQGRTSFSGYRTEFVEEMKRAFLEYRTEGDPASLFDGLER
jgi:hypothetical protein